MEPRACRGRYRFSGEFLACRHRHDRSAGFAVCLFFSLAPPARNTHVRLRPSCVAQSSSSTSRDAAPRRFWTTPRAAPRAPRSPSLASDSRPRTPPPRGSGLGETALPGGSRAGAGTYRPTTLGSSGVADAQAPPPAPPTRTRHRGPWTHRRPGQVFGFFFFASFYLSFFFVFVFFGVFLAFLFLFLFLYRLARAAVGCCWDLLRDSRRGHRWAFQQHRPIMREI
jgi:hypothetical protein